MKESLDLAKEELKRVDHLIYVSLKYTRTVDVLLSVVDRMINAYGFAIDSLLKIAKENKKIENMPDRDLLKAEETKKLYEDEVVQEEGIRTSPDNSANLTGIGQFAGSPIITAIVYQPWIPPVN